MKRKRLSPIHWILIVSGLVLGVATVEYGYHATKPAPQPERLPYEPAFQKAGTAPDFSLPDRNGRLRRLSELVTGPTIVAFADDTPDSRELLRYVGELCRRRGAKAPRVVTVAGFPRQREAAFIKATGLPQTLLYEDADRRPSREYLAMPAPRLFHLDRGLKITRVGPSPAEVSIYDLGVAAAGALDFDSPFTQDPRAVRAPEPVGLDRRKPGERRNDAAATRSAQNPPSERNTETR